MELGQLKIKKLVDTARLPTRAYKNSVGLDLYAHLTASTMVIPPQSTKLVSTGLAVDPNGYTMLVCSRSGLATKGIFVANAPGVVDPDYRGEIKVILFNGGFQAHYVRHGDRIAQLIVLQLPLVPIVEVRELSDSDRGESGFGSSGQ